MSVDKVVIVGGVAGGANAAARLRRLSEQLNIIVIERGSYISFANCGLPYFIGGEIKERSALLMHTPKSLYDRYRIDVRVRHEVVAIDRTNKTVSVRNLETQEMYTEVYDALVLATGAAPLTPPIPGRERPGLYTLRDIPDMDAIDQWIKSHPVSRAVVVGGGFIGLEMVEQLVARGLQVALVEGAPQVLLPLDPEMAQVLHRELVRRGVQVFVNSPVSAFGDASNDEPCAAGIVTTANGLRLPADLIILGIGVRPEVSLATACGLEKGNRGGIKVDDYLQTSDPSIWAVGDCIETLNPVTNAYGVVPLGGPANRQGRLVAEYILGRREKYRGTLGTAVVRVFEYVAACTGANEKVLKAAGIPYQSFHLHPNSHASYYPGAEPLALKIVFSPDSGLVLGAQAVGKEGAERRIDVISTAISGGLTVEDLAHLELCYAPPLGSAKDPVNMAGMIGENIRNGLVDVVLPQELPQCIGDGALVLDVRSSEEVQKGAIPGALHIPLPALRESLDRVPRDREIVVYCQSGQRSYIACRLLSQHGYKCKNLSGAFKTWDLRES